MSRWRTRVDPVTLRTMRSGLNIQREGALPSGLPLGGLYRAVVLKTYATDDAERTEGERAKSSRLYEIECDILLTRSLVAYPRVPVSQESHSVNDGSLWIPRPSTRVIGGGDLSLARVTARGALAALPPNLEDLDGDQVLVGFIEGDQEKPIILRSLTHAKTKRLVVNGPGWQESALGTDRGKPGKDERYTRYRGVELRINDQGDVLVDTVGATAEAENEVPALLGGQVRLRVKGTEHFTVEIDGQDVLEIYRDLLTQQPRVDLVEGASEQYIRGTTFVAKLTDFLSACATLAQMGAVAGATGAAASIGPLAAMKPAWTALGNAFGAWGGTTPALPDPGVTVVPPATAPVGVFSATLIDEVTLSTKIRGD